MKATILVGDVLSRINDLPDESVQCVVTSPPYWGLRDYGVAGQLGLEKTPEEYIAKMVAVFREVRRVLRNDGTCWVNMGDSYTSGGRKERDPGQSKIHPAFEGKRFADGLLPDTPIGLKPKDLVGIPWMLAFALRADGWYLRQDIIWAKPNPMPESVTDRCTKSHEYLFLLTKGARYYYDQEAIKEKSTGQTGLAASFERETKECMVPGQGYAQHRMVRTGSAQRKVRSPAGWKTGSGAHGSIHEDGREQEVTYAATDSTTRNKRSVWTIATQGYSEAHFATFPEALVEPCILAGSKDRDIVLDPFCGSGTTGVVALRYHREFVGIELNPAYAELSQNRIGDESPMFNKVEIMQ